MKPSGGACRRSASLISPSHTFSTLISFPLFCAWLCPKNKLGQITASITIDNVKPLIRIMSSSFHNHNLFDFSERFHFDAAIVTKINISLGPSIRTMRMMICGRFLLSDPDHWKRFPLSDPDHWKRIPAGFDSIGHFSTHFHVPLHPPPCPPPR